MMYFHFPLKLKLMILKTGDPKQLPPTVLSPITDANGYSRSLFERLQLAGMAVHLLDVQHRMHPLIREFSSLHFYENRLKDGNNITLEKYRQPYHSDPRLGPLAFLDIPYGRMNSEASSSYYNQSEIDLIYQIVTHFIAIFDLSHTSDDTQMSQSLDNSLNTSLELSQSSCTQTLTKQKRKMRQIIGIITPYNAQKNRLIQIFQSLPMHHRPEVNTIDGFQGREKDIIIMSCVRSKGGSIGFLSDERRLNVAITRARYSLILVGSGDALRSDKMWEKLLLHIRATRGYFVVPFQTKDWFSFSLNLPSDGNEKPLNSAKRKRPIELSDSDAQPKKFSKSNDQIENTTQNNITQEKRTVIVPPSTTEKQFEEPLPKSMPSKPLLPDPPLSTNSNLSSNTYEKLSTPSLSSIKSKAPPSVPLRPQPPKRQLILLEDNSSIPTNTTVTRINSNSGQIQMHNSSRMREQSLIQIKETTNILKTNSAPQTSKVSQSTVIQQKPTISSNEQNLKPQIQPSTVYSNQSLLPPKSNSRQTQKQPSQTPINFPQRNQSHIAPISYGNTQLNRTFGEAKFTRSVSRGDRVNSIGFNHVRGRGGDGHVWWIDQVGLIENEELLRAGRGRGRSGIDLNSGRGEFGRRIGQGFSSKLGRGSGQSGINSNSGSGSEQGFSGEFGREKGLGSGRSGDLGRGSGRGFDGELNRGSGRSGDLGRGSVRGGDLGRVSRGLGELNRGSGRGFRELNHGSGRGLGELNRGGHDELGRGSGRGLGELNRGSGRGLGELNHGSGRGLGELNRGGHDELGRGSGLGELNRGRGSRRGLK
jgi:hypothetical protein